MSSIKDFFFGIIRFVLISTFVLVFVIVTVEEFTDLPLEPFANSVHTITQLTIREWLMALMILVPGFATGGIGLYVGLPALASAGRLAMSDPIRANEVHLADGAVEVEGTVEPFILDTEDVTGGIEVTLTAPTSGKTCVAYSWEKKEKEYRPTRENPTIWATRGENKEAVPFYVTDGSGRAAVDPTHATLSLKPGIERKGIDTREYEGRLHPGDSVHVYGYKHEVSGKSDGFATERLYAHDRLGDEPVSLGDQLAGTTVFIGHPPDEGTFKISDTSKLWTTLRSTAKGLIYSLGGVGLLTGATYGVYILYSS